MKKITLALVLSYSFAQENYLLDEIRVNSDVDIFDFSLENQSRSVSILDKEDLMKYSSTGSIQSVLENAPGILYSRSGGSNGQITIRGMNSNTSRSVVTLDGVRFGGRNTLEFNMFDPSSIDSVEIIRGPASSLYGSDAMNGVINFKSRRYRGDINKDFDMDFRLKSIEYSSVNNMFGSRVEALGGGDGFDVLLGAYTRNAGDYRTPEGKALNSKYNSFGFDTNVGYTDSNDIRYYLQGRFSQMHSRRAGGLGAAPGSSYGIFMEEDPIKEYYLRLGLEGEGLSFADSYNIYGYWRHWDTDIINDRRNFNGAYILQEVNNNNYLGTRFLFNKELEKHFLTYGIETLHSISPTRVKQNVGLPVTAIRYSNRASVSHDFSSFIKDDYSFNDSLMLSGSLRGDYILQSIGKKRYYNESPQDSINLDNARNIDEAALTGALGAIYHFNEFFSVFGNLSHNFKAPSTGQMMQTTPAGNATEATIANTNLKSEYSQTIELGTRFESQDSYIALSAFYTRYTDMIALSELMTDATGNNYRQYQNIGKANISGVELEAKHKIDRFSIGGNLSGTYGQDETNRRPLAYIAPLYGRVNLNYDLTWGFLEFAQRAYKGKTRINVLEERKTKSYTMSDLYLGLHLGRFNKNMKNAELLFGVENIFDQKGMNPVTVENIAYARSLTNPLLEPGRNFFLKFEYNY